MRRSRNRVAVLNAYGDLIADGNAEPNFEQVAERAGVSFRSIYRYFASVTDLKTAATERTMSWLGPLVEQSTGDSTADDSLGERVDNLIGARLDFYGDTADIIRHASSNAGTNPQFAQHVEAGQMMMRDRVAEIFAAELAELANSSLRVSAIAQSVSFPCLDFLMCSVGHTRAEAQILLHGQVMAALDEPPAPTLVG